MGHKGAPTALRAAGAILLASALCACGGGGGGGANGPTPGPASIVPTPSALGSTLYADASTLRPMKAGATWSYRGHDTPYTGAAITSYTDVVAHESAGDGVRERGSNVFNEGADAQGIVLSNSSVMTTVSVALPDGTRSLTYPELRSPLRQNDQYTLLEQHFADGGVDLDSDGKNDAVDVALYWVVVGAEDLSIENLPTLHTVRVDTVELVRARLSVSGDYTPVEEVQRQSTWYAPGVGIVRRRLQAPSATVGSRVVDETITGWDGTTAGLGYTLPAPVNVPAAAAQYAGQRMSVERAALAFDDHAVILAPTPGIPAADPNAAMIGVMDLRGQLLSTRVVPRPSAYWQTDTLLRNGSEIAWVLAQQLDSASFSIVRLDAFGNTIGDPQGAPFSLGRGRSGDIIMRTAFAADGSGVWAAWIRRYVTPLATFSDQLVVRKFAVDGQAVTAEVVVVDWGTMFDDARISIVANAQGAVARWIDLPGVGSGTMKIAAIAPPYASAVVQPWPSSLSNGSMLDVDLGSALGFVWSQGSSAFALRLDSGFAAVLSPGQDFGNESVSRGWGGTLQGNVAVGVTSTGGDFLLAGTIRDLFWSDSAYAGSVNVLADYGPIGAGPLASLAPGRITRWPAEPSVGPGDNHLGPVRRILAFPDRVIVLGGSSSLVTSVVWRR